MKNTSTLLPLLMVIGCASSEVTPPPAQPAAPPPSNAAPSATGAVSPATQAPEPAPPTPEQVAAAEAQKQLEADFAKLEQDHAAELARLTPEVREQVKALTQKSYPSIKSAITAALAGPQRRPGHAERDAQRHPIQTLEFLGVKPTHKVLEYGPGEGWYTELLAPALAKRGKLYVTLNNPDGPKTERSTYYGKRTQLQLDSLPEAYSAVERTVTDPAHPALNIPDGALDAVLLFRGAHGMVNGGSLEAWLSEFHRTLAPKGILGVEQHRAVEGADPTESSKRGYLPEAFVIEQATKAGFKLLAKSEINANPKDTKDYPLGVWALPPTLRGGETDREKYLTIGESDRMTLKFVKVESPKPKAAAGAPAPAPNTAPAPTTAPGAATTAPATTAAATTAPATTAAATTTQPTPLPAAKPAPAK